MTSATSIHIPINSFRLKMTGVIYAILALLIFFGFYLSSDIFEGGVQTAIRIAGGIIALLLVFVGSGALKLLGDKSAGLLIDKSGIHDKSNSISVGQVSWKSIREIETRPQEKIILIHVKKNEDILKQASNRAIRQLLEKNIQIYKTPVILECKYLNCTFDDLQSYLQKFSPLK